MSKPTRQGFTRAHLSRALMLVLEVWLTELPTVCPSQVDWLLASADFGPPDEKEDCVRDDVRYVGM